MFQWAGFLETAPWAVGFTNRGVGGTNKREYIWVWGARLPGWEGGGIYKNILIPNFFSTSFSEAFIHLQTRQCLEHLGWCGGGGEGGGRGEGSETEWSVKSRCQNYMLVTSLRFSWNKLDDDTENKETSIKNHRETFGAHIRSDTTLLIR